MFKNIKNFFAGDRASVQSGPAPLISISANRPDLDELQELFEQALDVLTEPERFATDYLLLLAVQGASYTNPHHAASELYEPGTVEFIQFVQLVQRTVRCFHVDSTGSFMIRLELKTGSEPAPFALGVF